MIEECSESGLSRREIAKNHGLNESTIRGWVNKKETLIEMKAEEDVGGKKRKRMEGGGRRPLDADMEAKLYEWVKDLRERNKEDKIVIFIPVNVIFYVLNHNVEINYQLGKLHSLLGNETNISTRVLNNTRTASLNLITQKVRARFIRSSRVIYDKGNS